MIKPRVLYLLDNYPAITETYIQAEIDALRDQHEIKIVALNQPNHPNHKHHPFFEIASTARIRKVIEEFRPDVLHSHWLIHLPLLAELAKNTCIPFTVRAHSFEAIWGERDNTPSHISKVIPIVNDDLCLGTLAFPFMRANLERAGMGTAKIRDTYPSVNYDRFLDRSPNGEAVMSGGAARPSKQMEDFLKLAVMLPDMDFNLYGVGHEVERLRQVNERLGNPVNMISPVQPDAMPGEYKKHRWLVLNASLNVSARGWPVGIAEAQASGVGVCMRNLRPDLKDYVGEGGFLYDSIDQIRDIISKPFPEEMRQIGFEHARKSDIRQHKHVLTDLWRQAIGAVRPKTKSRSLSSLTKASPTVSVVLPTFNRAATLIRAIDSIMNQTFGDFELIVVDDGSTDETALLLRTYHGQPNIRVVSQDRRGCAAARNVGVRVSRGRYIAFQDSDDEWMPDKLEKAINTLEGCGPEVGVFYSDMLRVQADHTCVYWNSPDVQKGLLIHEERLDYQVAGIGVGSAVIRRECFDRVGLFDETLPRFGDLELFIRLSDDFEFFHHKEPLVKYYAGDGISADREALIFARQYLIDKYRQRLSEQKYHLLSQQLRLTVAIQEAQLAQKDQSIESLATLVDEQRRELESLKAQEAVRQEKGLMLV